MKKTAVLFPGQGHGLGNGKGIIQYIPGGKSGF